MAVPFGLAEFREMFPELASIPDAIVTWALTMATNGMDEGWWGQPLYDSAFPFLVAHWAVIRSMQINPGGSAVGGISSIATSKKVGDVSVNYSEQSLLAAQKDPFMRTTYGQIWASMRPGYGVLAV